jgi:beta-phosphoglucomutase-like phosphatase (HAD superfamily)
MNVQDRLAFEEVAVGMFTARAAGARVIAVAETHIDARAPLAVRRSSAIARAACSSVTRRLGVTR